MTDVIGQIPPGKGGTYFGLIILLRLSDGGTYPLFVTQREIVGHPTRAEHWDFVVFIDQDDYEVHELEGNYDTFEYVPKTKSGLGKTPDFRGGCLVGFLRPEHITPRRHHSGRQPDSPLVQWLRSVEVVRGMQTFDCQNWIIHSLVVLREQGVILSGVNEKLIREELGREKERDEYGEDLLHERIMAVKAEDAPSIRSIETSFLCTKFV